MEFKEVKLVDGIEQKSTQELERELLEKHESQEAKTEDTPVVKVTEGGENPQTTETVEKTEDGLPPSTEAELQEEDVLSYIKGKYNKELTSIEDLFKEPKASVELPEDVQAFLDYREKTGRGMEDYLKLSKDYSTVDEDQLLADYFLASGEALEADDVDILMDEYDYDEDVDEERDIKKKQLAKKKQIAKAREFFEKQKEEYYKPFESNGGGLSPEQQKELEATKQYIAQAETAQEEAKRKRDFFIQKTDEVFNDFKGFEFKIGESNLTYKPTGDISKIKEEQTNPNSFVSKYLDQETGLINDAAGYHKALAVAMNPDKFAQFFYEQGKSEATEGVTRSIKNIDMSERATTQISGTREGVTVRAVNDSNDSGRLRIKSKKH